MPKNEIKLILLIYVSVSFKFVKIFKWHKVTWTLNSLGLSVILWAECWGKLEDTIRRTLMCEDIKYNLRLLCS